MSKIDFKGTGDFARVNNFEAAISLFEDYDIPYHVITRGENEGRIKAKALREWDHKEYDELRRTLEEGGYGSLLDHANVFRDVDDCLIITFSPYHMPYEGIGEDGKIKYHVPEVYGYECEVRHPGIYGYGTTTAVYKRRR